MKRSILSVVLACCVCGFLAKNAFADQIQAGELNLARGRIIKLDKDRVKFRTADSATHYIPLTDIDRITADENGPGLKDFNAAEDYLAGGDAIQAAVRYERALLVARDFWPQIIKVRLLIARDRAGHFGKAAKLYMEIVETMPDVAIAMMPQSMPDMKMPEVHNVQIMLSRQIRKQVADGPRVALLLYYFAISQAVDPEKADELAVQVADLDYLPDTARTSQRIFDLRMDALKRLAEKGEMEQVLKVLDRMMSSTERDQLVGVLMFKAKLYFELAEQSQDQDQYVRAGWAWMRVAIHFADSPQAGEALLGAARVHQRIGSPEAAQRLLEECLSRKDLDKAVRKEAKELKTSLQKDGSS